MSEIDQPQEPQSSRPLTIYERLDKIRRGEATIKTKVGPLKFNKKPKYVGGLQNNGEFCTLDEGDYNSRIARSVAFRVAPSVVALTSFVGEKFRFSCSGFFIEWNDMFGTILTSSSLFIGYKDTMPTITNVTVEVHLPNRKTVPGSISHVDLHHNIAILTVPSVPKLHVATLLPDFELFTPGKSVVALGRHGSSYNLLAAHGEVLLKDHDLDSDDVLTTGCVFSRYGVGGPLVDIASGSVIGMNFTDANCSVFLPNTILLRCLKHFKSYGYVFVAKKEGKAGDGKRRTGGKRKGGERRIVRPWLGMRTRILDSLKMARLETIYQKFPTINGVFVEKVTEGSPADSAGVCPGDIVTHCDEIPVCSPLEFAEVLFDKAENSMELRCDRARDDNANKRQAIAVEVVIRRESCGSDLVKSIIIDRLTLPEINRWPLFRPRELQTDRHRTGLECFRC